MKSFLNYYQEELLFLRKKGGIFAKEHPEIADKLDIKNGESSDPHTERIIESFAFTAAKINKKIDENSQNIAFYLLSALYPNLINDFPPCSIVKFNHNKSISLADKIFIPKNTTLFANSKSNISCTFKTVYPLNLYPINIDDINIFRGSIKTGGLDGWSIDIKFSTKSIPIEKMEINDLLLHINSDIIEDSLMIYESIFSNPSRNAFLKINDIYIKIDNRNIIPCGFNDEDSVCPVSKYSNNSFQLFQEALHFKRKFMFFRILGLDTLIKDYNIENIYSFSIIIDINFYDERLSNIIKKDSIVLNSVPIVNLFNVTSDPIRFDGTKNKYLLLADQMKDRNLEIHSISNVHMIDSQTKEDNIIQPYFSLSIDSDTNYIHDIFWTYSKESADIRNLSGSDTYISFIDSKMNPNSVYSNVVYASTMCTNRFEARDIPIYSKLDVEGIEISGYIANIIHKTTKPIPINENTTTLWDLISQLSSTHISISQSDNLLSSITKLINIFGINYNIKVQDLIGNIKYFKINKKVIRIGKDAWRGFVEGLEICIYIKHKKNRFFSYLFGSIINQYLSSCVSINSFIELKLKIEEADETLAKWLPTSGRKDLI